MSYPYTEAFNTSLAVTYTQDSDVSGDVTNTDTPMYTKNWLEDPDKVKITSLFLPHTTLTSPSFNTSFSSRPSH
jgi:hypothetical protein